MRNVCPYIEPPTIPEGMTCAQYRINRPRPKVSGVRRLLRARRR
jgi:hypothetical protein